MLKLFSGKKLTIIGGTGYIGLSIAKRASSWGISVYAVSRKGRPGKASEYPSNITWVKGSAMSPDEYSDILKDSDAVIHTVGTLIDTTVFGGKKPGDPGSYEQMNRDTAKIIGSKLNEFNKNQKIVYISANKAPPMLERYISTKREAEKFLLEQKGIRTTILRPGFVVSGKDRPWSVPLKYLLQFGNFNLRLGLKALPESVVRRFMEKFESDDPIDLEDVAMSAILSAFDSKYDGKILLGDEMRRIAKNCIEKME